MSRTTRTDTPPRSWLPASCAALACAALVGAGEVTLQNDDGEGREPCTCFIEGEHVAAWLTSTCGGRLYALKLVMLSRRGTAASAALRDEFSLLCQLQHPNLIRMYEFGEVEIREQRQAPIRRLTRGIYCTAELVEGADLAA